MCHSRGNDVEMIMIIGEICQKHTHTHTHTNPPNKLEQVQIQPNSNQAIILRNIRATLCSLDARQSAVIEGDWSRVSQPQSEGSQAGSLIVL